MAVAITGIHRKFIVPAEWLLRDSSKIE
jgi:hypothetical protein